MEFQQLLFYFFATILVFAAFMVITIRNPVKAAMFLVLAFFSAAGLWMLLEAEFLSIVLVLVYVGAVMVLFLFVVMMLDINLLRLREGFGEYLPIGGIVAAIALTLRRRKGVKSQNVAKQVSVRREDNVRVLQVPSEPRAGADKTE